MKIYTVNFYTPKILILIALLLLLLAIPSLIKAQEALPLYVPRPDAATLLSQPPMPELQKETVWSGHYEAREAGRRSPFARFLGYVGHQSKAVVTDTKNWKWDLIVLAEVGTFLADNKSTCDGFAHGFRESRALYGHTNSCAKLTVLGSGYTFGRLVLMHSFWDEVVPFCDQDVNARNPEGCRWATPIVFSPLWIQRVRNVQCNEAMIDGGCRGKVHLPHPSSMVNRKD